MNKALRSFTDYMDAKSVKYTILDDRRVQIKFSGENANSISANFIFNEDCEDVAVRSFSIAKVPAAKLPNAYAACSALNNTWRWVKFYIDKDDEVTAALDAVIEPRTCDKECFELLMRFVDIVDKAYPDIMKMIWA